MPGPGYRNPTHSQLRVLGGGACLALLALQSACGGGGGSPRLPASTIVVTPAQVTVVPGQQVQFTATVVGVGPGTQKFIWAVAEAGGGSVDATGAYIASAAPGIYHVQASL